MLLGQVVLPDVGFSYETVVEAASEAMGTVLTFIFPFILAFWVIKYVWRRMSRFQAG